MSARREVEKLLALIQQSAYAALDEYEKSGAPTPCLDSLIPHPLDHQVNTVHLRKIIRNLEGACDQLCSTLAPPTHTIANRAQDHYWACLRFAAKTRITDALIDHPKGLHVAQLADMTRIDQGKLSTILRLLATRHCYCEVEANVFANSRLSLVLHSSQPMSSFVDLMTNDSQIAARNLYDMLADPEYAYSNDPRKSSYMHMMRKEGHQGTAYDVFRGNDEKRSVLGKAMIGMNSLIGSLSVLQIYPWDEVRTVCDVGSGVGSFAWPLLETYFHIHVTLHDLPETINMTKEFCAKDRPEVLQSDRVAFAAGDFFLDIPVKGADVYYLRNIIHNWPDIQAVKLLQNARQAMSLKSRLLIHEHVMRPVCSKPKSGGVENIDQDTAPEPLLPNFGAGQIRVYNQDLTMLVIYNAKERTIDEFAHLGMDADLKLQKVWDLGETTVLEFLPNTS